MTLQDRGLTVIRIEDNSLMLERKQLSKFSLKVGDLLILGSNMADGIAKLRRNYGKVFGFRIGPTKRVVVISDPKIMRV